MVLNELLESKAAVDENQVTVFGKSRSPSEHLLSKIRSIFIHKALRVIKRMIKDEKRETKQSGKSNFIQL